MLKEETNSSILSFEVNTEAQEATSPNTQEYSGSKTWRNLFVIVFLVGLGLEVLPTSREEAFHLDRTLVPSTPSSMTVPPLPPPQTL